MELDDLKRLWEEQDRKLDASLRLNARAVEDSVRGRARAAARLTSLGVILELVLAFVPVLWLGSFIADHVAAPRFWIPAALLDVFAIATFGGLVRRQVILGSIEWSAPVLEIQKRLATVRVGTVRATKWTFFLAPLLWPPLFIVAFEGFLGVDAYEAFGGMYIAGNVLFGLACLALAVWISRRYANRMQRSSVVRGLMRSLAGRNLAAAEAALGSLDRFAQDGTPD
jgi:hypothetical protein